jgi:uncharacterized protein
MAAKFELKPAKGGKFMFNLKAPNGKVVLTSELYDKKRNAIKGIEAVKKSATIDKRFEEKKTRKGELYFVLRANNGEIVGTSESYRSMMGLKGGLASVKAHAPEARVEDITE